MTAQDKVSRLLDKLKSESKKPEAKKSDNFFKDISEMEFDKITESQVLKNQSVTTDAASPNVRKIELLLRKIEDIKQKMDAGNNYLMYYSELNHLESEFLDLSEQIKGSSMSIPPQLSNRIEFKKHQIQKKRHGRI